MLFFPHTQAVQLQSIWRNEPPSERPRASLLTVWPRLTGRYVYMSASLIGPHMMSTKEIPSGKCAPPQAHLHRENSRNFRYAESMEFRRQMPMAVPAVTMLAGWRGRAASPCFCWLFRPSLFPSPGSNPRCSKSTMKGVARCLHHNRYRFRLHNLIVMGRYRSCRSLSSRLSPPSTSCLTQLTAAGGVTVNTKSNTRK
jgi:hypothetical protein